MPQIIKNSQHAHPLSFCTLGCIGKKIFQDKNSALYLSNKETARRPNQTKRQIERLRRRHRPKFLAQTSHSHTWCPVAHRPLLSPWRQHPFPIQKIYSPRAGSENHKTPQVAKHLHVRSQKNTFSCHAGNTSAKFQRVVPGTPHDIHKHSSSKSSCRI